MKCFRLSGRFLATTLYLILCAWACILGIRASAQDLSEGALDNDPEQRQPRDRTEATPENIDGYDLSPNILDMDWTCKDGLRFRGQLVRAGSKTVTLKVHNQLYQVPLSRFTDACQGQVRRFQMRGRIEPFHQPEDRQKQLAALKVESYTYIRPPAKPMHFLLYAPDAPRSSLTDYPLLVFLHGSGGAGSDNFAQWTDAGSPAKNFVGINFQQFMPCYVMIPQADEFDNPWIGGSFTKPKPSLRLAIQAIDTLKASVAPHIDMQRLFITGLSAGAYGCFDALMMFPGKFAAAVPISAVGDFAAFNRTNVTPMWMSYHTGDVGIDPRDVANLSRRYSALGVELQKVPLPGNNHDAWSSTYSNSLFRRWLELQSLHTVTYPSDWKDPVREEIDFSPVSNSSPEMSRVPAQNTVDAPEAAKKQGGPPPNYFGN